MTRIYEATAYPHQQDFFAKDEAIAFVERHGEGRVTTFVVSYPDGGERSCAMIVYADGAWRGVDISR